MWSAADPPAAVLCPPPQTVYAWYVEDASPRFSAAQSGEELGPLRELLEEAELLLNEVGACAHFGVGMPGGCTHC